MITPDPLNTPSALTYLLNLWGAVVEKITDPGFDQWAGVETPNDAGNPGNERPSPAPAQYRSFLVRAFFSSYLAPDAATMNEPPNPLEYLTLQSSSVPIGLPPLAALRNDWANAIYCQFRTQKRHIRPVLNSGQSRNVAANHFRRQGSYRRRSSVHTSISRR